MKSHTPPLRWFHMGTLLLLAILVSACSGRRSEQFRGQGDTYLGLQDWDKAQRAYQRALESNPANTEAMIGLGEVEKAHENWDAALAHFMEAFEQDPSSVRACGEAVAILLARDKESEGRALIARLAEKDAEAAEKMTASLDERASQIAVLQEQPQEPDLEAPEETTAQPGAPSKPDPIPLADFEGMNWEELWRIARLPELLERRETVLSSGAPNSVETLVLAALFSNQGQLIDDLKTRLPQDSPFLRYLEVAEAPDLDKINALVDSWEEEDPFRKLLQQNAVAFALARIGARQNAIRLLSSAADTWPDQFISLYNIAQIFRALQMPRYCVGPLQTILARTGDDPRLRSEIYAAFREARLFDDARAVAESAYAIFPESGISILNLANAYLDTQDFVAAEAVLSRGIQVLPDSAPIQIAYAAAQLHIGLAEEVYTKIDTLPEDPQQPQRAAVKAFSAAELGKWDEVVALLPEGSQELNNPSMFTLAVAANLKLGNDAWALEALQERESQLRLYELLILGSMRETGLENLGEGQKLAGALRQHKELLPGFAYGLAALQANFSDVAYREFTALLDTTGADAYPLLRLIFEALSGAVQLEDPDAAADALADQHGNLAETWIGLAEFYKKKNKILKMEQPIEKVTKSFPDNSLGWRMAAEYYHGKGDVEKAAQAYSMLLAINPDEAATHNNLAYCLLVLNRDIDKALESATFAQSRFPNNPSILHTLGLAQMRNNKLDDARKNLSVALELRPGDPTILLDLSRLLQMQGQEEEARAAVVQALQFSDRLGIQFDRRDEALALAKELGALS